MKKALIVVTNHTDFEKPNAEPTGLWLSELTHFYDEMETAGVDCTIVSVAGGKVSVDKRSLGFFVLDKSTKKRLNDSEFMSLLEDTKSIQLVNPQDYDVLYIAGGHGAMFDMADNPELNQLIRDSYESNKVVAAVCHGVAALQNVKLSSGEYLIADKKGTGFPYFDEAVAGVKKLVPYNLEKRLKERGMKYSKALFPLAGHSVVDGNLITGQNPNSTTKTAKNVLQALAG